MRPGLFAGGTIVLIWSFTELGTPLMFDFYRRHARADLSCASRRSSGNPRAVRAGRGDAASAARCSTCIGKIAPGSRDQTPAIAKASVRSVARPIRGGRGLLALLLFVVVIALALLPHIGVILMSFSGVGEWYQSAAAAASSRWQHYRDALSHDLAIPSVRNSVCLRELQHGASTSLLGLAIAMLIVRARLPDDASDDRQPGDAAAGRAGAGAGVRISGDQPAVAGVVSGRQHRAMRSLVDVTENPTLLLVIAYAMRRLPYVVRSAVAGLEQTPVDLELAARNLGASRADDPAADHRAADLGQPDRRRTAGVRVRHARGERFADPGAEADVLADHQGDLRAVRRLGDGPYIASALGVWAMVLLTLTILSANALLGRKHGGDFPGLTALRFATLADRLHFHLTDHWRMYVSPQPFCRRRRFDRGDDAHHLRVRQR